MYIYYMCEFVPVVDVYMARRVINPMLLYIEYF